MKKINDFTENAISQNSMYSVSGGKKTEGGTYMLDDVEMCYSSDRKSWITGKTRYKKLAPCGCECE